MPMKLKFFNKKLTRHFLSDMARYHGITGVRWKGKTAIISHENSPRGIELEKILRDNKWGKVRRGLLRRRTRLRITPQTRESEMMLRALSRIVKERQNQK